MSFDVNPSRNLSNVQASAKSCPGGGGNTGYFRRGKKKKEDDSFHYSNDELTNDKLELSDIENVINAQEENKEENFLTILKNFFSDILNAIKNFFAK